MVRMDPAWIDARGIPSRGRDCLASMGIYLFNRQTLVDLLTKTDYRDFGREIFPAVDPHAPRAGPPVRRLLGRHRHDPLVLRRQPGAWPPHDRPFDLASGRRPIYTRARFLAPSRHRRRHGAQQPDRRRLPDRKRRGDRKQRRSGCAAASAAT